VNRARRPPLQHSLAPVFERAVDSLGAALSPGTTRHYRGTVRKFLCYLAADHPAVNRLDLLRREPHILGWMSRLRSQTPSLPTASCINQLIALRCVFNDLAWTKQCAELARLITEGSLAALEFGFCELHLDTVVAFAVEANTGSRRVMEKVGMVYGSDFDHPSTPELSPLRRHVL